MTQLYGWWINLAPKRPWHCVARMHVDGITVFVDRTSCGVQIPRSGYALREDPPDGADVCVDCKRAVEYGVPGNRLVPNVQLIEEEETSNES